MKSYRNALGALVLAFVFSTSTFAEGIIWTERTPPPPPPRAEGVMWTDRTAAEAEGILWTEKTATAPEDDALTEIMLNLLQTLILLP